MLEQLLRAKLHYCFNAGPNLIRSLEDARTLGINCGALAHLAIEVIFGIKLPSRLLPLEMYYDREWLEVIPLPVDNSKWLLGDIAFFTSQNAKTNLASHVAEFDHNGAVKDWRNHPHLHVAVYTGEWINDQPAFIHATNFRKKVEKRENDVLVWTLAEFIETKTYNCLCVVKRLRKDKQTLGAL